MSKKSLAGPLTIGGVALAALVVAGAATPAYAETEVPAPSSFTSAFTVIATPEAVINNDGVATPGQPGAAGTFTYRINSDLEIICYDITLTGVSGDYMSPAKTATHIHQAVLGQPGPPRIAFPNPAPVGDGPRTSSGCLQGPFTTGIVTNGADTGTGFTLAQIEANPAGFASDAHTVLFPAGVVRGQLTAIPAGGVQTGGGGMATGGVASGSAASDGTTAQVALAGAGVAAVAAVGGVLLYRRRTASAL